MLTTAGRDNLLANLHNKYVGLITAITAFRAGTITEASYSGYARAQASLDAAENTSPTGGRQRKNTSAVSIGSGNASGSTVSVIAAGLFDASTAGNLLAIAPLDSDPPVYGTVTLASPGVINSKAHGLSADQRVYVFAAPGIPLPTGFSEDTAYYVGTVPGADSLTLSTTAANANPVNTSDIGACIIAPYTPLAIVASATPQIAAGALIFQL